MRSAQPIDHAATSSRKAVRRSPAHWVKGHPRPTTARKPAANGFEHSEGPTIVRFPVKTESTSPEDRYQSQVARERLRVMSGWSAAERERRRVHAIRKQEELMMLVACMELEDTIRLAVADGEQPVLPPEMDMAQ